MHEYRLSPQFFSQLRRRILIFTPPILLIALIGGFWVGGRGANSITPLLITIPLLLIVMVFSITWSLRQQKKHWSTYRLIVDDTSLKKVQDGLPDISISFAEISKITDYPKRGLLIQALAPPRQIYTPATLEDYNQLRTDLANRHPFESVQKTQAKWMQLTPLLGLLIGLIGIVLFVTTFKSSNPFISTVTGIFLFAFLVLGFVVIQRSAQVPKIIKWSSWSTFFPLLAIAFRVIMNILIIFK
jgi:hypothetical protein